MTPDYSTPSTPKKFRSFLSRHVPPVKMLAAIFALGVVVACQDALMPTEPQAAPALRFDASGSGALIMTDKSDYAPGDTVKISGSGWAAGETVKMVLDESDGDTTRVWNVVADGAGNFNDRTISPQPHDLNVTFTLVATGLTSGRTAQAMFTDGNVKARSQGAGETFNLTWNTYNGQTCAAGGSSTGSGSASAGFSGGAQFTNGVPQAQSITLTAALTETTPAGAPFTEWVGETASDTFIAIAGTPQAICIPGNFTSTRTYVAKYGTGGTTLVLAAPSPASVTYASTGAVAFSATLTRNSPAGAVNGATINFTVDGVAAGSATTNASGVATVTNYNPSSLGVGPHTVAATFAGQSIGSTVYAASNSNNQTLTVTKADPTVTAVGGTFTFDNSAHAGTGSAVGVNAESLTPVTLSYVGTGSTNYPASATAPTNAGTYTVTASFGGNGNYNSGSSSAVALTINKATPVYSALSAPSIVYGTTSATVSGKLLSGSLAATGGIDVSVAGSGGALVANATLAADGTFSFTVSGTEALTVSATGYGVAISYAGSANYNAANDNTLSLIVTKAASTTAVTCTGAPFTYNGLAQTPCSATATGAGGLNAPVAVTYTNNTKAGTAGASATFAGDDNHEGSNAATTFEIGKRAATWNTAAANKTYGDADPSPLTTGSGTDFVAGDNVTATYSRAAGETVAGGPYAITATLASTVTGALDNYTITNNGGDFTITKRAATWTTNNNSKTYGNAEPSIVTTGSGSNFVAGDGVTATYARAAGETVAGGPYHITATLSSTVA
ncbi:MAG: beta strand repeat-containing protein, partial [Gemmatimonadaceae bacterium]